MQKKTNRLKYTIKQAGILTMCLLAFSCAEEQSHKPTESEKALAAAFDYYENLRQGKCDRFVDGMLQNREVAPSYYRQLVLEMEMYLEKQDSVHRGIKSIEQLRCDYDSINRTAEAFLILHFHDGTSEQIAVPMIKPDSIWWMR